MDRPTSPPTLQINTSQDGIPPGDHQVDAPTTPRDQPIHKPTVEEWGQILKDNRRNRDSGNM